MDTSTNRNKSDSSLEGARKLASIVFIDIEDFSNKLSSNQQTAMSMLEDYYKLTEETVSQYGGKIVKKVEETILILFESVVNSTQCSIDLQQQFLIHNNNKSENDRITARIGIHLGDVIVQENDVFGDGVNIASRIHSLAEAGGITISESVYQQVANKLIIHVVNLGTPQLKGIDQPIKVYQVVVIPSETSRSALATRIFLLKTTLKRKKVQRVLATSTLVLLLFAYLWLTIFAPKPPENSLAILPFKNLGNPNDEYLVDGFTEDLISVLSQLQGIRVLSQGTTYNLKNTQQSEVELSKRLNVQYLLLGGIEIKPNEVVVRVRLAEPDENRDLWSQNITKSREELLAIKHEIFRQLALKLETTTGTEHEQKTSMEVYDLYLRGLDHDRKQSKEDNRIAISYFQSAVEKDTTFASGYLKLASCQLLNFELEYDKREHWLIEAERNIQKAGHFDSTKAELFWVLGRFQLAKGNRPEGIANLEKTIRVNPNFAFAYYNLGWEYLSNLNNPEMATQYFTKAHELQPTDYLTSMNLAIAFVYLKNYQEAIKSFRNALTIQPFHDGIWFNVGYLYERLSELDSAEYAYSKSLNLSPSHPATSERLAAVYLRKKQFAKSDSILAAAMRYEPNNYELYYMLGISKQMKGNIDSAKFFWQFGLRLAEEAIVENPRIAYNYLFTGLLYARLGMTEKAIKYGNTAIALDSSESIAIGMARIYALLGQKEDLLTWFAKARTMNQEYDDLYIPIELDFTKYVYDQDLLFVARR